MALVLTASSRVGNALQTWAEAAFLSAGAGRLGVALWTSLDLALSKAGFATSSRWLQGLIFLI